MLKALSFNSLNHKEIKVPNDPSSDNSYFIRGIGVAPGYAIGPKKLYTSNSVSKGDGFIICINSKDYSPDKVSIIADSEAIITWNCGLTGHIPVICRGMGKGCVIIKEDEIEKINNSNIIELFGIEGILITGQLAEDRLKSK